jgi:ABC-type Fe3+/spermidine/putrescine transport system ATPase subunit
MTALTVNDVYYEYRNAYQTVKAVNGVSCQFEQGKVYAITGASGSGKTTLLSLLAGLDLPTKGTIELDGKSTKKLRRNKYRLNHVSVIYQNYNLFYHLTVLENPQPYATAANDIHKFLVDAGMLDSYSGSSAVYRMDGLVLIVTVSKIGGGENATTECSFIVSDYMPGGHDEVIFKNGHYTFAYLDAIN